MANKKRVVITGLGIFSPLGVGIGEYWRNLLKNNFPIKKISLFPIGEFKCKYAFQIGKFKFNSYFKDLKSDYIPRSTQFLLIAVKTALKDSNLQNKAYYDENEIGVFTSSIYGDWSSNEAFYNSTLLKGPDSVNPMAFPPAICNYPSNYVSMINNFKGANLTFSSGFQGGLEAINFASSLIKQGYIKTAVVNGLNDLASGHYLQLSLQKLLYKPDKRKKYRMRIFDNNRDGFILGENSSTIILESIIEAKKRKAKMYAEVLGYSANFGKNIDDYTRVITDAIKDSGLRACDIDLCMLNANGIKSMDSKEINAVRTVFKDYLNKIDLVAIKENNGECEGASSIIQTLVGVKAIHSNIIPPPVYRYDSLNGISGLKLKNNSKRKRITNVLINSFDLEGNNASLIIKKV